MAKTPAQLQAAYRKRHPERSRASYRKWRANNLEKARALSRAWNRANPDKMKAAERQRRFRRYGITEEFATFLFELQGEVCAGCLSATPNTKQTWHIDHNHKTGVVRGLLCAGCNSALGHAKDNPATLRRLADYVESN